MAINVLIVIDGEFQFQTNSVTDFTFNSLVSTLKGAGFQVTTANREADPGADHQNFVFGDPSINLLDFDMIWMIADGGINDAPPSGPEGTKGPVDANQLNAIANYMEQGGGVFAVGDHYSLGSDMCGQIPRVRIMRSWYGLNDPTNPPVPANAPFNFTALGSTRADTTVKNSSGTYPTTDYMGNTITQPYAYFENQSDALPQTITPTSSPAHPILRNNGHDVTVYPDHMHEGNALGVVPSYDYTQLSPYGDTSKREFRTIASAPAEMPTVIATGQSHKQASYSVNATGPVAVDSSDAGTSTVNTLSVYDGRNVGVGRIVTGSTFHHYLDINLTGVLATTATTLNNMVGGDAEQGQGLSANAAAFADIQAVYVNITNWLARPRPAIGLILDRSTFSQNEVTATPNFPAAIYVTVDGLKPTQFPGGGINTLSPSMAQLTQWAPTVIISGSAPITIVPTGVASDDPTLADRLQRFTFTYQVNFTGNAFGFTGNVATVPVSASLTTSAATTPLTDSGLLELIKDANPYMLDLADGNTASWLSSDIKVFHVVAGDTFQGVPLPANATRADALNFLRSVVSSITPSQFTQLPSTESGSVLSVAAVTTGNPPKPVYNFALARVRLSPAGGDANPVQVFFRTFISQTTAALTYQLDGSGMPTEGYLQTSGTPPIDLPGTQNGGTQWLSFPYFSAIRVQPPSAQTDSDNSKLVQASVGYQFYGALIDNNLNDPYLTSTPVSGGPQESLPTILMGEHLCVVTEVIYMGAPILNGATPSKSDKISQRNLAISAVANPGLSASRVAMHTFEIEATPGAISADFPPDELLFAWSRTIPSGTLLNLHIPTWNAQDVVDLAKRFYARHDIRAIDAHTIELPAGGDRYVPIPKCLSRQTGVLSVQFPLGIRKGQRFDVSVQQITNRQRITEPPPRQGEQITLEEARKLIEGNSSTASKETGIARSADGVPRGVFGLGDGRTLVTDLSVFDSAGDHAIVLTQPSPKLLEAASLESRQWREPIGAFQIGIPVSTQEDMLLYHLQLLSIMSWRVEHLDPKSPWYPTMVYYLELLILKGLALGGNPHTVPPTPDGNIPVLHEGGKDDGGDDECEDEDRRGVVIVNIYPQGKEHKK
ncbi:hypothetical protein [Paraburkholderia adhaesiva]|uniref:hypothetical protein n=1 Tax=Paraburkholderia adhaesiva TaxID=2883244 RepID=UPI001F2EF57B|nr:hypothetical protein [Paraburkholderia adhaesiva]